jgi:hypothetical protein
MAYPLNHKQLCQLLIVTIPALTTYWALAASNSVENKIARPPGHWASYCLVESIDISDPAELAVLYFGGSVPAGFPGRPDGH